MGSGTKFFLFIMLLPFLAGAGHDIYLNYFSDPEKVEQLKALQIDPDQFLISDLGWIWTEYAPGIMKEARTLMSSRTWSQYVDPVLQLPTMVVSIVPFFCVTVLLLIAFILGIWPFSRFKAKQDDFAVYKHAKTKAVKYSKK